MILTRKFYARKTEFVARDLLGKTLVMRSGKGLIKGKIVETEAYLGKNDPGAKGYRKIKKIPKSLLNPPGYSFVYFTYGNHWMLNILAKRDELGAVLIRALEPLVGIDEMKRKRKVSDMFKLTNGPGKLTQALGIDKRFDGQDVTKGNLYIEDSENKLEIVTTTRIGISKGKGRLLRYYIRGNQFVSRK